jgi:hypothetical protein
VKRLPHIPRAAAVLWASLGTFILAALGPVQGTPTVHGPCGTH